MAKLMILLASSIMIASASADIVNHMFLGGKVDVIARRLVWILNDQEQTTNVINVTLQVDAGGSTSVNDTVYLKNNDDVAHNLTITVTKAVDEAKFDLYVDIYSNATGSWEFVYTLDATQLNNYYSTYSSNNPLIAGKAYKLNFRVTATADATDATFELRVDY